MDEGIKNRLIYWYLIFFVLLLVGLYVSYGVYFVDLTSTKSKWIGLEAGAIAIFYAALNYLELLAYKRKRFLIAFRNFLNIGILASIAVILFHIFKDFLSLLIFAFICLVIIVCLRLFKVKTVLSYAPIYFILVLSLAVSSGACTLALMGAFFPIVLASNGIFSSIITSSVLRFKKFAQYKKSAFIYILIAALMFSLLSIVTALYWFVDYSFLALAPILGALLCVFTLIVKKTRYSIPAAIILLYVLFYLENGVKEPLLAQYAMSLFACGYCFSIVPNKLFSRGFINTAWFLCAISAVIAYITVIW